MATKASNRLSGRSPKGLIGVKELRAEASGVVSEVEAGEWFLVSKRGVLVGALLPADMIASLLDDHAQEIVALQIPKRGA